jgi:hypothetical protein
MASNDCNAITRIYFADFVAGSRFWVRKGNCHGVASSAFGLVRANHRFGQHAVALPKHAREVIRKFKYAFFFAVKQIGGIAIRVQFVADHLASVA